MWVDTYAELEFDRQLALATALEGQPRSSKYGCTIKEDFSSTRLVSSAGYHVGVGGVVIDGAEVGLGEDPHPWLGSSPKHHTRESEE